MSLFNKFVIFFIIYICYGVIYVSTDNCNEVVCCPQQCSTCGTCTGNATIDALCCETTILLVNHTCDNFIPPCVIGSKTSNTTKHKFSFSDVIAKFGLAYFILIIVAFFFCIFLIYICCFFGKKKPPVDYADIVGKYN